MTQPTEQFITKIKKSLVSRKLYQTIGILLAMLIAAWVGNHVALYATRQIVDEVVRFVAAIFVAFLVGLGVGYIVKKAWDGMQNRLVH